MGDVNGHALNLEPHRRQQIRITRRVGVAVDRRDRRNRLELIQECRGTDVTRVKNVINLAEDLEDLGPQKPMSIRDDTEAHGGVRLRD